MVQRIYRQIREVIPDAKVTVATSKTQVSAIHNQLGECTDLCVEPCRKNTFPALALAAAYLHDIRELSTEEALVFCPVDPYVEPDYFRALANMEKLLSASDADLVLMGIKPAYPSEKYGYILPADSEEVSRVVQFKEKPDVLTAQGLIDRGALWNGGVFACKLNFLLKKSRELLGTSEFDELYAQYDELEAISFDRAVAEKEKNLLVLRYDGDWKDLGTWNTLTEAMEENSVGDTILNDTCENVHVINELDVPVLCMGLKDVVVSASPEGILVSDKAQSSYIRPYVDQMDQRIMFAEKSWGSFRVIDVEDASMTIKVTLNPGCSMNYHSHERRDEVWTIISGEGRTIVDGMEQPVQAGDVVTMQAGCRHTIIADTELKVMEVQLGKEISVHDKRKFELEN